MEIVTLSHLLKTVEMELLIQEKHVMTEIQPQMMDAVLHVSKNQVISVLELHLPVGQLWTIFVETEIQMQEKNATIKTQQEAMVALIIAKSNQIIPALLIQWANPQFVVVNFHHQE